MGREVERFEWKVKPSPAQTNASVSRAVQQIVAQKESDVFKNVRWRSGVKTVTSVIDPYAGEIETGGLSTDPRLALDQGDVGLARSSQPPGRTGTGGSGPQDGNVWSAHGVVDAFDEGRVIPIRASFIGQVALASNVMGSLRS